MRPLLLWLCPSLLLLASLPLVVMSCRSSSPKARTPSPEAFTAIPLDLWQPETPNLRQPSFDELPADLQAAFTKLLDATSISSFAAPTERVAGAVIPVMGPRGYTACESWIPLPVILWEAREPLAGRPWEFQVLTAHMAAPAEWPMALLAGRPGSLSLDPFGYQGCWLVTDPIVTFWPGSDPTNVFYRPANSSRAWFHWNIPQNAAGEVWRFQAVVFVPRDVNPGGAVLSQAVDLFVGSKP